MKEIEVKILEVDRKAVEKKLSALGAKKEFEKDFTASIYDFPNLSLRRQNKMLRFRLEGEKAVIAFKQKISNKKTKIAEETEFVVSDGKNARKVLESIGLIERKSYRKRRISYSLNGVHFEFDQYLGKDSFVPEFLEIEAPTEKMVFDYAKKIGFEKKDCIAWTGKQVMEYYEKKK